jgi:hypothetical protein
MKVRRETIQLLRNCEAMVSHGREESHEGWER